MGKYNLTKLTRSLFPWFWQNDTNNALLDVSVEGVFGTVNDNYEAKEADVNEMAGYSIQRLSLENGLNKKFDYVLQRIEVSNGSVSGSGYIFNEDEVIPEEQEIYIFNESESLPTGAEEAYFYNIGEPGGGSATGFTVTVPIEYQDQEYEIRAWIEFVMIFGTDYTLIFM